MPYRVARSVGDYGEQVACRYLEDRGYVVVDRNWRCDQGELDIVALHRDTLVFCEVKTRRSNRYGSPVEAVVPAKAARLRRLALQWLREHDLHRREVRIDVLGVLVQRSGAAEVEHLRGVA
nr:YraN family protein [Ornithinicoccus hortensis]